MNGSGRWRDTTAEATAAVLAAVVKHAGLGIALVGLDGVPFQANPAIERLTGYTEDELLTMTFADFTHPDEVATELVLFQEMLAGQRDAYQLEKRWVQRDGTVVWVALTASAVRRTNGDLLFVVALVEDVTGRRQLLEEVRRQALHDDLTGLPNRRLFHDRLEHACRLATRQAQGLAVVLIDLDGFKYVNDTYGHAAGDEVLCAVASAVLAACRESDTVARLGGDEFAVLCEGSDSGEHADGLVERLRSAFPISVRLLNGLSVAVAASVGSAVAKDTEDYDSLLTQADQVMYQDKAERRSASR